VKRSLIERLHLFDWENLPLWKGNAQRTPELVQQVIADYSQIRLQAYHQLYEIYFHQQTAHISIKNLVPFFLEFLQDDTIQGKDLILRLLESLVMPVWRHDWLKNLSREASNGMIELYHLVKDGLEIILPLLNDPEPDVRIRAAELLSQFSMDTDVITIALESQIARESNMNVKNAMIKQLEWFMTHN
jgi:hypothetical protein